MTARHVRIGSHQYLIEPVDCHARSAGGTLVRALLQLAIPISEQAASARIPAHRLAATVGWGMRPRFVSRTAQSVLTEAELERLGALLALVVADPSACGLEAAEAWAVGCAVDPPPL